MYKSMYTNELHKMKKDIRRDTKECQEELSEKAFVDQHSDPFLIVEKLTILKLKVKTLKENGLNCENYQQFFDTNPDRFDGIITLDEKFDHLFTIWAGLKEYIEFSTLIFSQSIWELDIPGCEGKLQHFEQTVKDTIKLEKQEIYIPSLLASAIEKWSFLIPIVKDLRSDYLKTRHWGQLKVLTGLELNDPSLTLETITNNQIDSLSDDIAEVAMRAREEASIKIQLKEVSNDWENEEFQVEYINDQEIYIFIDTQMIQEKLDETLVKLTGIASNRFVSLISETVEKHYQQFSFFSAVLDELILCHKQWFYLQKIFLAPDMARQLKDRTKKFKKIHENFKEIMGNMYRRPNALEAVKTEGLLGNLKK